MKINPYKHAERYKEWYTKISKTGIPDISKENSDLIIQCLDDLEDKKGDSKKKRIKIKVIKRINQFNPWRN